MALEASLQNVVLQLLANALDPEDRLRCREVLSPSSWRLSRLTPAFLACPLSIINIIVIITTTTEIYIEQQDDMSFTGREVQ